MPLSGSEWVQDICPGAMLWGAMRFLDTSDPAVPERQRLEHTFVRARWLAGAVLAVLAPIGGFDLPAVLGLLAFIASGNVAVWRANRRVASLAAQRLLSGGAVTLDALAVLGVALWVPNDAATAAYATTVIVVTEAAVRFSPPKAGVATVLVLGGLAAVLGLRTATADDPFDGQTFAVVAGLAVLLGGMVGLAVREIYSTRVAAASAPAPTAELPEEALALLTPRERQVMGLILQGYSNPRIAAALVVEPKTVKNHINNIYSKLQLGSRYEAIATLLRQREAPRQPVE